MRATHDGKMATLTVVGHSYGSTATGLALQRENLKVDQVVLIGSPGVGGDAKTATDLKLKPSQVFVGSASQDEVTTGTDRLGADPSHQDFGPVVRFKAESVDRDRNSFLDDHSLYYDEGNHSESLYNLASIVTGHGDRLGPDGMLAEPRHTAWKIDSAGDAVLFDEDPEAIRTPTAGYDHTNDPRSANP
jgi:pimeloyl-ACP methyl ester carboxylesterase